MKPTVQSSAGRLYGCLRPGLLRSPYSALFRPIPPHSVLPQALALRPRTTPLLDHARENQSTQAFLKEVARRQPARAMTRQSFGESCAARQSAWKAPQSLNVYKLINLLIENNLLRIVEISSDHHHLSSCFRSNTDTGFSVTSGSIRSACRVAHSTHALCFDCFSAGHVRAFSV